MELGRWVGANLGGLWRSRKGVGTPRGGELRTQVRGPPAAFQGGLAGLRQSAHRCFTFRCASLLFQGSPVWLRQLRICLQCGRPGFDPWVGKIPWIREWLPTPVFWPGEFRGQRSLVGYSPWGRKELDRTEWLTCSHFSSKHFLLPRKPGIRTEVGNVPRLLLLDG